MKHKILLLNLFLLLFASTSMAQHIEILQQDKPTSIRGLSVVDDNVAWISGSKGTIAITKDGGKTWNWQQVKGFEKADFRDIEAFSAKEAIIMSSGTPALIMKTTDGGEHWQVKYKNTDTAYFLDAMSFSWNRQGYVLGDPINNKFVLLETNDGGETWTLSKNPPYASPGEAAFAASGTCIRAEETVIYVVTGGSHAHLLISQTNDNNQWQQLNLSLKQGKASQGAFSLARGMDEILVVGGDYQKDKATDSIVMVLPIISSNRPAVIPQPGPSGYQSCVEYVSGSTFLSTGTPGSNITKDGGKTWNKIDDASYNVCRKAKHGTLVLLAGDHGKIAIFKP